MPQAAILALETNRQNLELLQRTLQLEGYRLLPAASLEEFEQILRQGEEITAALIDLTGFDPRIWEEFERLRARNIPILVIAPSPHPALQQESLAHGARIVLVKPLGVQQLLGLLRSLLESAR